MRDPRCLIFFPGTRPELLPKALASGAPLVCVDLEDAVGPEQKGIAREHTRMLLTAEDLPVERIAVRVNHPATPDGQEDLRMLVALTRPPGAATRSAPAAPALLIPKVEGPGDIALVRDAWAPGDTGPELIPVVETARGLAGVFDVAGAQGVGGLLFGGLDLSLELGASLDWEALLYARSRTLLAARVAGVPILDTPHFDLDDEPALIAEARRARRLGFDGKAAIHPRQVRTVLDAFSPSQEEVAGARRMIDAAVHAEGGAFALDGVMVDRPALEAARRIVAAAGETTGDDPSGGGT